MNPSDRNALVAFPVLIIIGLLFAWAGSQGGSLIVGVPLFALSVGLAFLIQWLAFIPAFLLQTEKFFDLTGSVTHLTHPLIIPTQQATTTAPEEIWMNLAATLG